MSRAAPVPALLFAAVFVAAPIGVVVSACSSDDSGRSSSGIVGFPEDSSTAETGPADAAAPTRPDLCTNLVLGGEVVPEIARKGEPPTPLGGTIGPGTYDLSALEVYGALPDASPGELGGDETPGNPLTGKAARATIVISASYLRFIEARGTSDALGPESVRTIVNRTSETSIVGQQLCPASAPGTMLAYSAVGTGLAIFTDANHRELYIRR